MDSDETVDRSEDRQVAIWDKYVADLVTGVVDNDIDWDGSAEEAEIGEKPGEITIQPVANGMACQPNLCPIALALMSMKEVGDVLVGRVSVRVQWLGLWYSTTLPEPMRKAIDLFDHRKGDLDTFQWDRVVGVPLGPWRRWAPKRKSGEGRVGPPKDSVRRAHRVAGNRLMSRWAHDGRGTTDW